MIPIKQLLIAIIFLSLATFSCSKNESYNRYHLTCKIDGVFTTFNANIKGTRGIWVWPTLQTVISGWQSIDSSSSNFNIAISTPDSIIQVGNYIDTVAGYNIGSSFLPDGRFSQQDYSAGSYLYYRSQVAGTILKNHLNIILITSGANEIRGTFSGDFYYGVDPTSTKKTITEGDFYVKIIDE
jgi:hypothetical protein